MKSPLWILNSILLLFLGILLVLIFYGRVQVPKRKSIEPEGVISLPKKDVAKVDPARIYQNDLFGTLVEPVVQPAPISLVKPIPEPPPLIQTPLPQPPDPKFLDPLKVSLRGIISFGDDSNSKAIIADETDTQKLYGIGDKIDDAYIIKIFENKVLLVRANGQQETLYLREVDAEEDRDLMRLTNFDQAIQKVSNASYIIDPHAFGTLVESLGQFIEVLDLTAALKKGKSFGIRVGSLAPSSLGVALGLESGDIIRTINGMPTATTQQRREIYNTLIQLPLGASIEVTLIRAGTPLTIHYNLQKLSTPEPALPDPFAQKEQQDIAAFLSKEQQKTEILRKQEKFAPTAREYKKLEREMMLKKARRRPLLKNII